MKRALSDPIADLLTRIRNALAVNKLETVVPHSKTKEQIVKLMQERDFIDGFEVSKDVPKVITIKLRSQGANSPIHAIQRVSKPGRRVYVGTTDIPNVMRGKGLMVVSTSAGIMSGDDARGKGLGGELMCKVW